MYDLKNPIRIHIDKLPAAHFDRGVSRAPAFGEYWVVCGAYPTDGLVGARRYREDRDPLPYESDIRNYLLLIEHDFSEDPDRIRYVMWGDKFELLEFYRDDKFAQNVEAFIEHEVRDPETGKSATGKRYNELCMREDASGDDERQLQTSTRTEFNLAEAIEYLNYEQNRWSFSQAEHDSAVDIRIFEAIERAWFAALQFVSFAVATAR
jgi:hypothetical protein